MLRREIQDMIDLAERLLAAGEVGVLATLFSARGSTYRPLGSMMVSGPASMVAGGVSGGCLEEYIARHGRLLVQRSPVCLLRFDADPNGADLDTPSLGCGGSIEVLVERLTADHVEFLRDFAASRESDEERVATCKVMCVGEGIQVERSSFSRTSSGPAQNAPASENVRTLIHVVQPMTRLVIFGAGDDVKPLCAIAGSMGWHVVVADRRVRRATRQRFPDVEQLVAAEWDEAVPGIAFTSRTAVVLMTHSLADDIALLPLICDKPAAYVGVLGPLHRRQWVIDGAGETASLPEAFLDRLKGPIGLNLGERSPGGIALSIAADIAAVLNARSAYPLSQCAVESTSRTAVSMCDA